MDWKDILVFADESTASVARVRMAANLAIDYDATVKVCLPILLPSFGLYGDTLITRREFETFVTELRGKITVVADTVRSSVAFCAERVTIETPEDLAEDFPEHAGVMGQTFDLVVVGQPVGEPSFRLDSAVLENALFKAGRPVLMLPQWKEPRSFGRRVIIGWKNVREAARAVHDALPILRRADAVRIFSGDDKSHGQVENSAYVSKVCEHLIRHGVHVEPEDQKPSVRGISLVEEAKVWGADLIVMGGFGHARLREFVFGGATREAIHKSPVPVLLSH